MFRHVPILLLIAGCNTPSAEFRDAPLRTVIVAGSTFDVRVNGLRAEALRTNVQYAPRLGPIGGYAAQAIEQVSGCRVHDIAGDQAVIRARLDCGDGPPAKKRGEKYYQCTKIEGVDKTRYLNCDPLQLPF